MHKGWTIALAVVSLVLGWHLLLWTRWQNRPVTINPFTNVATIRMAGPLGFGIGDPDMANALRGGLDLVGSPIVERILNTHAREYFDVYAMLLPYRVDFVDQSQESIGRSGNDSAPIDDLPPYIIDALNAPDLVPSNPIFQAEISLGEGGQRQLILVDPSNCGSGDCSWTLTDAETHRDLIGDQLGSLHKVNRITDGYYDLLLEAKNLLILYQHDGPRYREEKCYTRTGGRSDSLTRTACVESESR